MALVPNQWREYGWQGGHFVQVSGPTSFPAQPASALLSVGSSDLVFHRSAGGPYVGELTVTVRNTVMSVVSRLGPGLVLRTFDGIADWRPPQRTYAAGAKDVQSERPAQH